MLHRARVSSAMHGEVPSDVCEVLNSPSQPLDADTRTFMETHLGHDFSRVRIHADAQAAESARAVNALAYTVGQDVVLGKRQYILGATTGNKLLAHELVHVVQQGTNGQVTVQRATDSPPSDTDSLALKTIKEIDGECSYVVLVRAVQIARRDGIAKQFVEKLRSKQHPEYGDYLDALLRIVRIKGGEGYRKLIEEDLGFRQIDRWVLETIEEIDGECRFKVLIRVKQFACRDGVLKQYAKELRSRQHPIHGNYLDALLRIVQARGSTKLRELLEEDLAKEGLFSREVSERVKAMSPKERLWEAAKLGMPDLPGELMEQIKGIVPLMMTFWVLSHVFGMGELIDALGLCFLGVTVVVAIDAIQDIKSYYVLATKAQSEADLRAAGNYLAKAAGIGIPLLVGALSKLVKLLGDKPGRTAVHPESRPPVAESTEGPPLGFAPKQPAMTTKPVSGPPSGSGSKEGIVTKAGNRPRADPKKIQEMKSQNRPWSDREVFASLQEAITRYRKNVKIPRIDRPESEDPVIGGTVAAAKTNVGSLQGKIFPGASAEALPAGLKGKPGTTSGKLLPATNNIAENHAEQVALANLKRELLRLDKTKMVGKKVWLLVEQEPCSSCASGIDTASIPGPIKQFSLDFPELTIEVHSLRTSRSYLIRNGNSI
ncbi:MAG: DUF4157 domain-containing protein [Anaerolineae bacterium]|nr:DUF4157 domain-containing protein [Anaerolineae bacterium]